MAIAYNAGTNTITVTGYTEATPCNFVDIYNADVAGGWGKVTRQCTKQLCFDCKVIIGDGSTTTWFADINKSIHFSITALPGFYDKGWETKANGHTRFGEVIDVAKKTTKNGCYFFNTGYYYTKMFYGSGAGFEMYSCYCDTDVYQNEFDQFNGAKIWNTQFNNNIIIFYGQNVDFHDITWHNTAIKAMAGTNGLFNKITILKCNGFIEMSGVTTADTTIKNTNVLENSILGTSATAYNAYFINIEADNWAFTWLGGASIFYRQYELDLKVIDKDNAPINSAAVKIWDKDSNLVVDTTTDVNGVITTQTITRGYYNQANGNTLQEASPHLIKIEKAGYTTYEADFTLEEKTDWLIALQVGGGGLLRNPPMTGGLV